MYRTGMYASSVYSSTGTIAVYAKKMAQNGRPDMEIILDNHTEHKVYTTFDALSGKVEITAPHSARFDEIQITLQGSVRTWIENLSPASTKSKTTALHNFLKLTMPIRDSDYPQPRIAEAGQTYTFPFNFVVPEQLLPRSCTHECTADHVHQAHLQLPPSMGDREVDAKDDLAPAMSKVIYAIKVKVIRNREEDGKEVTLVEGLRKIHIRPTQAEAPPMSLTAADGDYALSKVKSLKKGMFSGKLGKITASAAQTRALILPPPAAANTMPVTTIATVNLRFDPHDGASQPPRLGGLTTKLKVSTFFAVRPAKALPTRFNMNTQFETTRGVYEKFITINSRCMENVVWKKHAADLRRKNSASSTSSSDYSDSPLSEHEPEPEPKLEPTGHGAFYTATLLVPITLPSSKSWIPTFHSCIVSRVYQIDLSLTIHTPGTAVPATHIRLHLPVQIAATGNGSRRTTLTASEAAAELADAEEFLRPRVVEMPSEELVGNSVLTPGVSELPPSYEDFVSPASQVVDPGRG